MIENMPSVMKLIDPESWSFFEHTASEFLFSDNISPNANSFTVISAVGGQSVGKSSLLNKIAGRNVFKTHNDTDNPTSYLKHLTRGIDLHVTKERLLLLDCQVTFYHFLDLQIKLVLLFTACYDSICTR